MSIHSSAVTGEIIPPLFEKKIRILQTTQLWRHISPEAQLGFGEIGCSLEVHAQGYHQAQRHSAPFVTYLRWILTFFGNFHVAAQPARSLGNTGHAALKFLAQETP